MIESYWQSVVAVFLVGLASLFLARRVGKILSAMRRGEVATSGCGNCPKNSGPLSDSKDVVPLPQLQLPVRQESRPD